jgi:hypothetical protein
MSDQIPPDEEIQQAGASEPLEPGPPEAPRTIEPPAAPPPAPPSPAVPPVPRVPPPRRADAIEDFLEPAPPPPKPKTDWLFFILGLLTPAILYGGGVLVGSQLQGAFGGIFITTLFGLTFVLFVVFLLLFLRGKSTGNVKLRSYGKGGMWAYAAVPLFLLLAFGTCLFGLQP